MIIDLPSTTTSAINKSLVSLREQGGAVTTGRVLTMVIVTDEGASEEAIAAANEASFEHPCRVIVIAKGNRRGIARLDAQIRVGGDAGASEVIVLRLFGELTGHGASATVPLLLPDAPVVVWWPGSAPAIPAQDPIGQLAARRITDAASAARPLAAMNSRAASYTPGDTDLAWTRLTTWRGLLAASLDQPPHEPILSVTVAGASDSPSTDLLAGWLALRLKVPVKRVKAKAGAGMQSVVLNRKSGPLSLSRDDSDTATLGAPGQPDRHLSLPRRSLRDCIAEELRRLDADEVYEEVLKKGLTKVNGPQPPARVIKPRPSAADFVARRTDLAEAKDRKRETTALGSIARATRGGPARRKADAPEDAAPSKTAVPQRKPPRAAAPQAAASKAASTPKRAARKPAAQSGA
ncbi:glucose-6-phosphate dehydrogenase assembly protein OpcA [Nakamurella antarctica]|uniref:Glucose-6-phosphate dehydrogenase assembly protein OpcA n=1 Tax=Nakamurella antarctica TaxID=1902245 RepID=A0A3G8ZLP0_9ACTN|nr:glucose-6-phosphate dehydrogenase assembly protein OpcA [Nakamurella antarctica]AZI58068.1 glucose-6-phosphate dehydrogenase assembly protein OpcA [Nakamurella antarctica]